MSDVTLDLPVMFPVVPGCIDGIVHRDPLVVQCPDCGDCFSGIGVLAAKSVLWNRHSGIAGRRCLACWADLGVYEGTFSRIVGDVAGARAALDGYTNWDSERITPEQAREIIKTGENDV